MKYPLTNEIYNLVVEHCGGEHLVIGNPNTRRQMKSGELNPTLKTLKKFFDDNGMPAEITITCKIGGKKGKTKIKL